MPTAHKQSWQADGANDNERVSALASAEQVVHGSFFPSVLAKGKRGPMRLATAKTTGP